MSVKPLVAAGTVSYSLYVFHGIVVFGLSKMIFQRPMIHSQITSDSLKFPTTIIVVTVAMAVSTVSYIQIASRFSKSV